MIGELANLKDVDDIEENKVSYMCKTCNTLFFSASEVIYHKAMTGHGLYEERKRHAEAT
jgi:hypothetical protein